MYKSSFRSILNILIITLLFPLSLAAQQQECFLLMVGKEASANGQVLLAHNNDLSGTEASMLIKVPSYETIDILPDSSFSFVEQYEMLVLQTNIGFFEGDAVAINEHGVAIAGGLALKRDRNSNAEFTDSLIPSGLGGGVRYFALQHSKTARECVEIIGKLYNHYGVSYPSGVGIADTNEIWYLEAGGGHSWAAVRIPNDCYFVGANSYRIGEIVFTDTLNYKYSPNLPSLHNSLNEANAKRLHFADLFGNGVKEKAGNNLYNTRRLWRTINILNPEMNVSSEEEVFPIFIKPEEKIDLKQCFSILRDYYQETPFDIYKPENTKNPERSIAVWDCVHTNVISLSPGMHTDYGTVLWTGFSTPFTAIYTPVYFGCKNMPISYDIAPSGFYANSAFWIYKRLGDLCKNDYPGKMQDWRKNRKLFETMEIERQNSIVQEAKRMQNMHPDRLNSYLNNLSNEFAKEALKMATDMIDTLEIKKSYITKLPTY